MASTSSQGPSPHPSLYDFDSNGDTDDSWQYLDFDYASGSSGPASIGFLPSPASGSLNGYAIVGQMSTPSHTSGSPLPAAGDLEQPGLFSQSDMILPGSMTDVTSSNFMPATSMPSGWAQDVSFLTPQAFLFPGADIGELTQQDVGSMYHCAILCIGQYAD